jgi:hypothetical protein
VRERVQQTTRATETPRRLATRQQARRRHMRLEREQRLRKSLQPKDHCAVQGDGDPLILVPIDFATPRTDNGAGARHSRAQSGCQAMRGERGKSLCWTGPLPNQCHSISRLHPPTKPAATDCHPSNVARRLKKTSCSWRLHYHRDGWRVNEIGLRRSAYTPSAGKHSKVERRRVIRGQIGGFRQIGLEGQSTERRGLRSATVACSGNGSFCNKACRS